VHVLKFNNYYIYLTSQILISCLSCVVSRRLTKREATGVSEVNYCTKLEQDYKRLFFGFSLLLSGSKICCRDQADQSTAKNRQHA